MKKKKIFQWMLAAILFCGVAAMFTSCTNDDNPATPDLGVKEKIIGKWMTADRYGQPAPTNKKKVFNIVSTTKAYMSASLISLPEVGSYWIDVIENDVAISGNKVTLTNHPDEHRTVVEEYTVTAINDKEFTANRKMTIMSDGVEVVSEEGVFRYVKVTADYSAAILGTWQGHCTSEGSVFDDGQEHRWQYNVDGTYVYYVKDANGQWEPKPANISQYFVDGNLLCTRWQNIGESENREWWEISIAAGKMNWTALRQNEDGTTFTATFEMEKVE